VSSPFNSTNVSGAISFDRTGRFLFVQETFNAIGVRTLAFDPATGQLSYNPTLLMNAVASHMEVDHSGKFLFEAALTDQTSVMAYSIGAGATLTAVSGYPMSMGAGTGPAYPVKSPTGNFLAMTMTQADQIALFSVGADGTLAPVPGSPANVGSSPSEVAFDATGTMLYVANQNDGSVSGFHVDAATGALTEMVGSPYSLGAGAAPTAVAVDPSGLRLYVALHANRFTTMAIAADGSLTETTHAAVNAPNSTVIFGAAKPAVLAPRFAYVVNANDNTIQSFQMDPTTGALTDVGTPVSIMDPYAAVADPRGQYLYAVSGMDGIHAFRILGDGHLEEVSGSPYDAYAGANGPLSIAMDPTGDWVMVPLATVSSVDILKVNHYDGSLTPKNSYGTGFSNATPVAVTMTPAGDQLWVSNSVTGEIDPIFWGGFPSSPGQTELGMTSNPRGIAFSADGAFGYVAEMGTSEIAGYTNRPPNALALVAGTPIAGGSDGVGLATDHHDHLFATDSGDVFGIDKEMSILTYAIDPTSGAITPMGSPATTALRPVSIAIDPSEKFMLVACTGVASPTIDGGLSEFALDQSGNLTPIAGVPAVGHFPIWVTIVGGVK
jgi:6-phosphogluconolactonase (cycloisomerase 2 family)